MIKVIAMTVEGPADRLIDVTVTLSLKESEIALHRRDSDLGLWLSQRFAYAIESGDYVNGQDVYLAADKLLPIPR